MLGEWGVRPRALCRRCVLRSTVLVSVSGLQRCAQGLRTRRRVRLGQSRGGSEERLRGRAASDVRLDRQLRRLGCLRQISGGDRVLRRLVQRRRSFAGFHVRRPGKLHSLATRELYARYLQRIGRERSVFDELRDAGRLRALELLQSKKNLRVIRISSSERIEELEYKQISGGMLVQTKDAHQFREEDLRNVTTRKPTAEEVRALLFAWVVCKHTKSNAIVYAREGQTVGVGAGQMSRVDSVKIGAMRAQLPVVGSVLASDAFFPFRDGIDEAAKNGITAVIQPGGSVKDIEVIAAAVEYDLAMVFTGIRHFKH